MNKEVIKAPEFDADSAYQYIQVQADFGPRVPNTQAHKECGEYLAGQLEKFGAKVSNRRNTKIVSIRRYDTEITQHYRCLQARK